MHVSKRQELRFILDNGDIAQLKSHPNGFLDHDLRREAWKLLLEEQYDCNVKLEEDSGDREGVISKKRIFKHKKFKFSDHKSRDAAAIEKDMKQIDLDVERSFTILKDGVQRRYLREVLRTLLRKFFERNRLLCYYQGYHDVVSVFVMVFLNHINKSDENSNDEEEREKEEDGFIDKEVLKPESEQMDVLEYEICDMEELYKVVEAFSLLYLRDFLMETLDFPIEQLKLIQLYIRKDDHDLYQKLQLEKIEPFYAISSILTIYSHELKPTLNDQANELFQIFDLIICRQSMFVPLQLYCKLFILHKRDILDNYEMNMDNFDNEVDLIHAVIQQILQKNLLDEEKSKKIFTEALDAVRDSSNDISLKETSKYVNKYCPLLTTARGIDQKYTASEINRIVKDQVLLHDKLQHKKSKNKRRIDSKAFMSSLLKYIPDNQLVSPLVKMSIAVGVIAVLLRYSNHRKIPFDNRYLLESYKKIRSLNIVGLCGNLRSTWSDPVDVLLGAHRHIDTPGTPRAGTNL